MGKPNSVHTPHRKNTALSTRVRLPDPPLVTIPMAMHIGAPANPVVKEGDLVKVGQPIAEAGGFVSAPIHASVSGKVIRLDEIIVSGGQRIPAVVIGSDGMAEPWDGIAAPQVSDMESFLNAVGNSGVVGLGGAGFPTMVKLKVDTKNVEALIINGAECEPYITSDTRTMLEDSDLIQEGLIAIKTYMEIKRFVIGVERNNPMCAAAMRKVAAAVGNAEVLVLPATYPQGGEKVLIYNAIGRAVPEGKLPIDVGAVVLNCTTVAAIGRYLLTGMPLVEKCVTVDGSAVKEPKNVIAPIGTPIQALFDYCGGFLKEPRKILYGGPMMGIAVPDTTVPVLKNTNAVIALDEKDAVLPEETACIRCGRCAEHCPMLLSTVEIADACLKEDAERLKKLNVMNCLECGCCSFGCPASRPLTQLMKLGKSIIKKAGEKK